MLIVRVPSRSSGPAVARASNIPRDFICEGKSQMQNELRQSHRPVPDDLEVRELLREVEELRRLREEFLASALKLMEADGKRDDCLLSGRWQRNIFLWRVVWAGYGLRGMRLGEADGMRFCRLTTSWRTASPSPLRWIVTPMRTTNASQFLWTWSMHWRQILPWMTLVGEVFAMTDEAPRVVLVPQSANGFQFC